MQTLSNPVWTSMVRTLLGPLAMVALWLATIWRQHKERRQLAMLSESALADIGLSRSDIERELVAPFWQPIDYDALEIQRRRSARLGRHG